MTVKSKSQLQRMTKAELIELYLGAHARITELEQACEREREERNVALRQRDEFKRRAETRKADLADLADRLDRAQFEASDWNNNYNIADRERSELRDLLDTALATITHLNRTIATSEQAAAERHQASQLHRSLNTAVEEFQDEFNAGHPLPEYPEI